MQGHLNEIDIRSILQLIELGQRTGELYVETLTLPPWSTDGGSHANFLAGRGQVQRSWFVFFNNGHAVYATHPDEMLTRLQDYLRAYNITEIPSDIKVPAGAPNHVPEYDYLWALLEHRILTPDQARKIVRGLIRETLFDLLSLHQGTFVFELGAPLSPQLTTLEVGSLVRETMTQVQEWKQFYPHIQFPTQCPVPADGQSLDEVLPANLYSTLGRWMDGHTSIRQMARYLNRDILAVARAIYPYVLQGSIQLVYPTTADLKGGPSPLALPPSDKVPRILYIDDGVAVGKAVEQILSKRGYEATAIASPLRALSLVFQLKPDLILCDIAMPELDGYELCTMLRSSTAFKHIPIVMLTGKEGLIDRIKARMAGATNYLSKPFSEAELLTLVEEYVGPGNPERLEADDLLAETLKKELGIE
ncbi:response regulator [Trichothermofontia sichuanensis B231]|uniref:response regulator n=1 Tax=Trichothermofontia sichuanensis TaxID=3045816 RepID=UPI0022454F7C|nr:response regulator [Trichothermofontia sichuanensis]UZQ54125.1 response regulator [Trichothermofontia sichuanensis B231]